MGEARVVRPLPHSWDLCFSAPLRQEKAVGARRLLRSALVPLTTVRLAESEPNLTLHDPRRLPAALQAALREQEPEEEFDAYSSVSAGMQVQVQRVRRGV